MILILSGICACTGQNHQSRLGSPSGASPVIGGPFENREFMFIGMPENISDTDTTAGWEQPGQKLLITGTIFEKDGITPAPGVLLYVYHTDIHGYYASRPGLDSRVRRHGYIRGWIRSGRDGRYKIYTVRPAPYPDSRVPAHIHPAIGEPRLPDAYYIDDFVFDDDPLLTAAKRRHMENRGGSGILRVVEKGDLQIAEHNIILGLHIPGYPETNGPGLHSGKEVGEDIASFTPFHAWGPDKGTRTCPICKYGRFQGILYFVGNSPDWNDIEKWLSFFELQCARRQEYLKAFFVYGNEEGFDEALRTRELDSLGRKLGLQHVALTFVPSFSDRKSDIYLNNIDPGLGNTILLYKNSNVIGNFVNLKAEETGYRQISGRLDATANELLYLPVPGKNEY